MSDQYRLLKTCYFLISDLERLLGGEKIYFDGNRELMIKECQKTMKSLGQVMDQLERHAGGGQDLGRPQADAHTMVGIQPRHLRIIRHHIHEYRQLLLKLETKPAWRKLSNIKAFELLELQHLVEMIDAYDEPKQTKAQRPEMLPVVAELLSNIENIKTYTEDLKSLAMYVRRLELALGIEP